MATAVEMVKSKDSNRQLTLVLFTQSYPYKFAGEGTFLSPELSHLARSFRIIIVPEQNVGQKSDVPEGVQVEEDFARHMQSTQGIWWKVNRLVKGFLSPLVWRELVARPTVLVCARSFRRLLGFASHAERTRKWVFGFIDRHKLDVSRCIFYSYWLDARTMGLGMAKKSLERFVLVSRVHGCDLYEERHPFAYIPCRRQTLGALDRLFFVSDVGRQYLTGRYSWFAPRCETARLGVTDPGFITSYSRDGVFRIASCSVMIPLKRVDLILDGLEHAARRRPDLRFEWHHFGVGPLKQTIEQRASKRFPVNVKCCFPGYGSVEELMQCYRDYPVDLFINASETEGTPVAVMEAISCGIPVLATSVGGNPEIVLDKNGWLLGLNPTPDEVGAAILRVLENRNEALEKRRGSREVWEQKYNAAQNYEAFAIRLEEIRTQV